MTTSRTHFTTNDTGEYADFVTSVAADNVAPGLYVDSGEWGRRGEAFSLRRGTVLLGCHATGSWLWVEPAATPRA